jgi:putative DNA primase/helicase
MGHDAELVAFLQRVAGYALTGSVREQCLFFLYGTGANGKTTFLNTLSDLFGDYARTTRPETLLAKRSDSSSNDVARLEGARLVTAAETEEGKRLAESLVKQLTGGDIVAARFLFKEFFEFRFVGKIFLATNYKPELRGSDEAIWRRVHLIPFAVRIPDAERDKELPAKLRAELPGILTWAVQGCKAWLESGLGVPGAVREATDSYREEMDSVGAFARERLRKASSRVGAMAMYAQYAQYCDEEGKPKVSPKDFPRQLSERGFVKEKTAKGNFWVGVAVEGDAMDESAAGEDYFTPEDLTDPKPSRAWARYAWVVEDASALAMAA